MDTPQRNASDHLSLDALTAGVSIYQRRKGHRFSSDDIVTAWVAMQVAPTPSRVLDLGCGIGSVLLHLAWSAPQSTLVGIEAQDISFELLRRNIAHNELTARITVHHGDLRDATADNLGAPFDLITGTPPYFPPDTASDALDAQRAFARIEYRGGIEEYTEAAATMLTADGWYAVCGDADASTRIESAAVMTGLEICRTYVVVPRAARPPLFTVWALRHSGTATPRQSRQLVLRDENGERTADAKMLRAFSGFPERETSHVEPAQRL